eukprot:791135_1
MFKSKKSHNHCTTLQSIRIPAKAGVWSTGIVYALECNYSKIRGPNWQVWRLLTSVLTHNSWKHLFTNCFSQILTAFWLEAELGAAWRMAVVCVASEFGCSALCLIMYPPTSGSVGSSGACYGFEGAGLSLVVLNWPTTKLKWLKLAIVMLRPSVATIYSLSYNLNIAHYAHLGGWLTGIYVGAAVCGTLSSVDKYWRKPFRWTTGILAGLVLVGMIAA